MGRSYLLITIKTHETMLITCKGTSAAKKKSLIHTENYLLTELDDEFLNQQIIIRTILQTKQS